VRQISDLGLWGNYSIPKDNPYVDDSELQPEIWALGLRNPWRCSFDSERPPYFFCADVGQDMYEEVDLISKGGNYGWRVYEGPLLFSPASGNVTLSSMNAILPVMGYTHSAVNIKTGSASITGGYVYRATADPCMVGRYLYTDLYASAVWEGTESPENSGNYNVTSIPFSCANDTPIPCESVANSLIPSLGFIFSFGEDNSKDVFLLTSKGVYRVVRPSRCGYTCSKESTSPAGSSTPPPSSSSSLPEELKGKLVLFCSFFLLVLGLSI
ncbi:hypothetical protein Taro_050137, partial [Colocasia esculenta]|nr:hypothetical protein [Colocasia esculenta]